jgi:hypothetical protein
MPSTLARLLSAGFALGVLGLFAVFASAAAEPPTGAASATGGLTRVQRWGVYATAAGAAAVGTAFVRFREYVEETDGGRYDLGATASVAVGLGFAGWLVAMAL